MKNVPQTWLAGPRNSNQLPVGTLYASGKLMNEAVVFEIDDLSFEVKCVAYTPGSRGGLSAPTGPEVDLAPLVRMTGDGIEPRSAISYGDFLVRYAKAYDMTTEAADNEIVEEVVEWVEDSIRENDLDENESSYYAEDEDEPWFDNGGD